jgi:hypothetical protein
LLRAEERTASGEGDINADAGCAEARDEQIAWICASKKR